ncbi:MAG: response regulator transcription factor [Deltaproteobacteria bacterium]|jgi:DNA-binding CsgD family transcriptional regulator
MDADVYVLGPRKLQNKLMASFLQSATGLKCTSRTDSDLNPVLDKGHDRPFLILLDCLGSDIDWFWIRLCIGVNSRRNKCFAALFNVARGKGLECKAINHGSRGIFFENDPPDLLAKGVLGILKGELWFSRETLVEWLVRPEHDKNSPGQKKAPLTLRQTEILTMAISGISNPEIAEKLCISQCTVKAHLHNIYRKIDVPNRFRAAIWACKNL